MPRIMAVLNPVEKPATARPPSSCVQVCLEDDKRLTNHEFCSYFDRYLDGLRWRIWSDRAGARNKHCRTLLATGPPDVLGLDGALDWAARSAAWRGAFEVTGMGYVRIAASAAAVTAAYTLSLSAATSCRFVEFTLPNQTHSNNQAGVWRYEWWDHSRQRYVCKAYPEDYEIDPLWKASRGFTVIVIVLGAVTVLMEAFTIVMRFRSKYSSNRVKSANVIFLLVLSMCSSLSLVFLRSSACQRNTIFDMLNNHQCRLSSGAFQTYAALMLWFSAGCMAIYFDGKESRINHDLETLTFEPEVDESDAEGRPTTEPLLNQEFV
ncbi:hypothetical protein THAOC_11714 [Thalassiosira oceanica]|uniref:Uncharacterized protein n=1 Tax=Thalassiosira oceanica TaxID=159749 RepID=K0T202_THAOC|nr:hypothetical protein THAOC_11714 [Thalassiosira oceanica]|eukprot:EJK67281.1 hypothetical protein THAOC_11714 [Thalassiosira oceanica]